MWKSALSEILHRSAPHFAFSLSFFFFFHSFLFPGLERTKIVLPLYFTFFSCWYFCSFSLLTLCPFLGYLMSVFRPRTLMCVGEERGWMKKQNKTTTRQRAAAAVDEMESLNIDICLISTRRTGRDTRKENTSNSSSCRGDTVSLQTSVAPLQLIGGFREGIVEVTVGVGGK